VGQVQRITSTGDGFCTFLWPNPGLERFAHLMKMILPSGKGRGLPVRLGVSRAQGDEEPSPVRVIPEDGFAPVPSIHHVVNRAFEFNAE